jgi:hypothetical protein
MTPSLKPTLVGGCDRPVSAGSLVDVRGRGAPASFGPFRLSTTSRAEVEPVERGTR